MVVIEELLEIIAAQLLSLAFGLALRALRAREIGDAA
jgi:hypothetical protein